MDPRLINPNLSIAAPKHPETRVGERGWVFALLAEQVDVERVEALIDLAALHNFHSIIVGPELRIGVTGMGYAAAERIVYAFLARSVRGRVQVEVLEFN